jgi:outer membrane protein OmpA-like peptidoglycan-associated protein
MSGASFANEARATRARAAAVSEFPPGPVPARAAAKPLRASQQLPGAPRGAALIQPAAGMRPSQVPVASVQRMCAGCEDEEKKQVQAKSAPTRAAASADTYREASSVLDVVGNGGGQPLTPQLRADMEAGLGADFSDVRIHTDAKAARSAAAISAQAYTLGNEIVFGPGSFAPESPEGRHTLVHELAHIQQQRKGPVPGRDTGSGVAVSDPSDSFEQEAEATASEVLDGLRPVAGIGPPAVGETEGPSAPRAAPRAAQSVVSREAEALASHAASGAPSAGSSNRTLQRLGDLTKVPPSLTCPVASSTPASVFTSIPFARGSALIGPAGTFELDHVITAWHAAGSSPTIRVDGYASTEGKDEDNWRLSCARVEAVVAGLTARPTGQTIPAAKVEVFAQGETNEFGTALAPNRRVSISTLSPLPAPVCTHPGTSRTLDVQPVFLRTDPKDAAPTGDTWDRRLATANAIWGKVGVTFNGLSPVTIDTNLKTSADVTAIAKLRASAGVQVFLVDNDLTDDGGAATLCPSGPCCAAPIVLSDQGTSDTILAHELGHIIGIQHPGVQPNPGDPGTIMQGSGSNSAANPTRNTMVNFNAILCPPAIGSTCLTPDP